MSLAVPGVPGCPLCPRLFLSLFSLVPCIPWFFGCTWVPGSLMPPISLVLWSYFCLYIFFEFPAVVYIFPLAVLCLFFFCLLLCLDVFGVPGSLMSLVFLVPCVTYCGPWLSWVFLFLFNVFLFPGSLFPWLPLPGVLAVLRVAVCLMSLFSLSPVSLIQRRPVQDLKVVFVLDWNTNFSSPEIHSYYCVSWGWEGRERVDVVVRSGVIINQYYWAFDMT